MQPVHVTICSLLGRVLCTRNTDLMAYRIYVHVVLTFSTNVAVGCASIEEAITSDFVPRFVNDNDRHCYSWRGKHLHVISAAVLWFLRQSDVANVTHPDSHHLDGPSPGTLAECNDTHTKCEGHNYGSALSHHDSELGAERISSNSVSVAYSPGTYHLLMNLYTGSTVAIIM